MKTRIITIITLIFCCISATAQLDRGIIKKLPQTDLHRWHFGFILGISFADYGTKASGWLDDEGNVWYQESAGMAPHFTVGMITDLRLCEYLNLRCTPVLHLGERSLNYTSFNSDGDFLQKQTTKVSTTTIDIPFYLKFSGKRYGNTRPYIIAGGGPMFNLNLDPEVPILLNVFDVQVAFGFGFNIYNKYFKFCPELKFYIGLLDQLNRNHPEVEGTKQILFTKSVDKMYARMLSLTFNFE